MKKAFEVIWRGIKKIVAFPVFWYVVIAFLAYIAWKRLTKPPEELFLEQPLPTSGSGIPVGWKPDPLALKFHNYFVSWISDTTELHMLYNEANSLTDDQFVALVNTYNAKYGKVDGKTLYTRVKSWWSIWFGSGTDQQDKFIQKMILYKLDY
ncbi:hypothetical protein VB776_06870 [Arcicella sp. DC2W]|uniref:Uncharacterized protein n=1 Tax=Arcicella gelida TaxID=2984195 RepID=A0ABU5S2D7_9BACT|nr:hypothetical protein [Arcicella sp. DC2W]MEA5402629.1 hypothetical protein [Arcicella sp. DC2W]